MPEDRRVRVGYCREDPFGLLGSIEPEAAVHARDHET
jgi:hypothetical protein